jgi:Zn-dependent protease
MLTLLVADLGHAIAHIPSARYSGAPVDEILISSGMPRTLYLNHDVSPSTHRKRALGGPIFSTIGVLLSFLVYGLSTSGALTRELAGWSLIGHGFILIGSLLPFPMVDGGSILKWTLVKRGRTPLQADGIVRRINWIMAVLAGISGIILIVLDFWIAGLIVIGVGGLAIGVASGKIK